MNKYRAQLSFFVLVQEYGSCAYKESGTAAQAQKRIAMYRFSNLQHFIICL
jgi:hypothetical protein